MKVIKPGFVIETPVDGLAMLRRLERAGRTCYRSGSPLTDETAKAFVRGILKSGHESVIEHESVSVRVICDRGITHEIVRHRLGSYSQESTRYCNYSKDKHGNEITFIAPFFWFDPVEGETDEERKKREDKRMVWRAAMTEAEGTYLTLIELGASPQEARSVLPNSLKTEIVMTFNLREWRHFFNLRARGTSGKPHPQMLEIAVPMLEMFRSLIPVVFDEDTF